MSIIRYIVVIGIIIGIWSVSGEAAVRVVGAAGDGAPPPAPTGVCLQTFAMTNGGILSFIEQSGEVQFDVAPLEASYDGYGYAVLTNATLGSNLYRIKLDTFTTDLTTSIDVAQNPDAASSRGAGHYNTVTGRYVNLGRQIVAPCAVSQNCPHFRSYAQGSLLGDTLLTADMTMSSNGQSATYDSTYTFVTSTHSTGFMLTQLQSVAYTYVTQVLIDAAASSIITNDTNYIYGTFGAATIKRWAKSGLGVTNFTPGLIGTVGAIAYDSSNNKLYVGSTGGASNQVYRINATTMAIDGTLTLGAFGEVTKNILIDESNDKLYIVVRNGGGAGVYRINRTTFVQDALFAGSSTLNGLSVGRIDVPHQKVYLTFLGGGGDVTKIQKVNLCT